MHMLMFPIERVVAQSVDALAVVCIRFQVSGSVLPPRPAKSFFPNVVGELVLNLFGKD